MRAAASVLLALPLLCGATAFPPEPPGQEDDRTTRKVSVLQDKFPGPQDGFMLRLQSLCGGALYRGRIEGSKNRPADKPLTLGPAQCELEGGALKEIELPVAGGGSAHEGWKIIQANGEVRLRPLGEGAKAAIPAEASGTFTRQEFPEATVEIVPGDRLTVRASDGSDVTFDLTRRIP